VTGARAGGTAGHHDTLLASARSAAQSRVARLCGELAAAAASWSVAVTQCLPASTHEPTADTPSVVTACGRAYACNAAALLLASVRRACMRDRFSQTGEGAAASAALDRILRLAAEAGAASARVLAVAALQPLMLQWRSDLAHAFQLPSSVQQSEATGFARVSAGQVSTAFRAGQGSWLCATLPNAEEVTTSTASGKAAELAGAVTLRVPLGPSAGLLLGLEVLGRHVALLFGEGSVGPGSAAGTHASGSGYGDAAGDPWGADIAAAALSRSPARQSAAGAVAASAGSAAQIAREAAAGVCRSLLLAEVSTALAACYLHMLTTILLLSAHSCVSTVGMKKRAADVAALTDASPYGCLLRLLTTGIAPHPHTNEPLAPLKATGPAASADASDFPDLDASDLVAHTADSEPAEPTLPDALATQLLMDLLLWGHTLGGVAVLLPARLPRNDDSHAQGGADGGQLCRQLLSLASAAAAPDSTRGAGPQPPALFHVISAVLAGAQHRGAPDSAAPPHSSPTVSLSASAGLLTCAGVWQAVTAYLDPVDWSLTEPLLRAAAVDAVSSRALLLAPAAPDTPFYAQVPAAGAGPAVTPPALVLRPPSAFTWLPAPAAAAPGAGGASASQPSWSIAALLTKQRGLVQLLDGGSPPVALQGPPAETAVLLKAGALAPAEPSSTRSGEGPAAGMGAAQAAALASCHSALATLQAAGRLTPRAALLLCPMPAAVAAVDLDAAAAPVLSVIPASAIPRVPLLPLSMRSAAPVHARALHLATWRAAQTGTSSLDTGSGAVPGAGAGLLLYLHGAVPAAVQAVARAGLRKAALECQAAAARGDAAADAAPPPRAATGPSFGTPGARARSQLSQRSTARHRPAGRLGSRRAAAPAGPYTASQALLRSPVLKYAARDAGGSGTDDAEADSDASSEYGGAGSDEEGEAGDVVAPLRLSVDAAQRGVPQGASGRVARRREPIAGMASGTGAAGSAAAAAPSWFAGGAVPGAPTDGASVGSQVRATVAAASSSLRGLSSRLFSFAGAGADTPPPTGASGLPGRGRAAHGGAGGASSGAGEGSYFDLILSSGT
jgi:hypothetical protein